MQKELLGAAKTESCSINKRSECRVKPQKSAGLTLGAYSDGTIDGWDGEQAQLNVIAVRVQDLNSLGSSLGFWQVTAFKCQHANRLQFCAGSGAASSSRLCTWAHVLPHSLKDTPASIIRHRACRIEQGARRKQGCECWSPVNVGAHLIVQLSSNISTLHHLHTWRDCSGLQLDNLQLDRGGA
jgi:hypothetical protein